MFGFGDVLLVREEKQVHHAFSFIDLNENGSEDLQMKLARAFTQMRRL